MGRPASIHSAVADMRVVKRFGPNPAEQGTYGTMRLRTVSAPSVLREKARASTDRVVPSWQTVPASSKFTLRGEGSGSTLLDHYV